MLQFLSTLIIFCCFTAKTFACDNSSASLASQTTNADGSITYTLDLFVELAGLDLTYYGSVLQFNSSSSTPIVVMSGAFPTTTTISSGDLTSGSISGTLQGLTGADINAVANDGDWGVYDNMTNVLSYESTELFGATSNSFGMQVQVTVMGCVDEIIFDSHVNSGASACEITIPLTPPTPIISGNITVNIGATTQLTATETPTASPWASSDVSIATIDATGLVTGVAVGTTTMTYTSFTGCTNSVMVIVSAPVCDLTIVSATPTAETVINANDGTITVLATCTNCIGTVNYSMTGPVSVGLQTSGSFTNLPDGTYTITVADSGDPNCTETIMVTINPGPTCDLAITGTIPTGETAANADDGTITVTATCTNCAGVLNYSVAGPINVGPQTSSSFANLPDGTYTITVVDAGDATCIQTTTTIITVGGSVPCVGPSGFIRG